VKVILTNVVNIKKGTILSRLMWFARRVKKAGLSFSKTS
jgi:hypothetical protein